MHKNRANIGKFWAVPRKGTKYLALSTHNRNDSIPLVVVIRDIMKLVRNKKELKKLLNEKQVFINNKEIRETNFPIVLFDVISYPVLKKNYRAVLSDNGKMVFEEISDKEAGKKVYKVIGKKILKGNIVQVNLLHGKNLLLKDDIDVDDSVVFNFKDNKIEKILKMEKGNKVYVVKGKHIGSVGVVEKVIARGNKKLVVINDEGKNGESGEDKKGNDKSDKINVWIRNVIVVE